MKCRIVKKRPKKYLSLSSETTIVKADLLCNSDHVAENGEPAFSAPFPSIQRLVALRISL